MKNHKIWNILGFVLVILAILAGTYVSVVGVGEKHQGSAPNIKLGLDLAGGVSITYEANESNPSAEDMRDTVYKLQQRVGVYSTEAEVYQEGSNRINVEIPGVYNAEEVLETLGNPGTIQFYEASSDSDSGMNLVLDGNDVVNAQVVTEPNEFGNNEYMVRLTFSSEGAQKFEEATARNIDKPIYIVYDADIISAPQVDQTISGGNCVITGNFTYDQANSLADKYPSGCFKADLNRSPVQRSRSAAG